MGDIITTEELKYSFSEYPKEMDDYFFKNEIIIKVFPDAFVEDVKAEYLNFKVTSAKEYYKYLNDEISFWTENDEKGKLNQITSAGNLSRSKDSFESALKCYQDGNASQGLQYLKSSLDHIKNGVLCSKTKLAQYIINYSDEVENFRRGLKYGLTKNNNSSASTTLPDMEGLMTALAFRGIGYSKNFDVRDEIAVTIEDNIVEANNNYAKLNEEYTRSFHELQEQLNEIKKQTNTHINDMNAKAQQYFDEKEKRCSELELLYGEKLHLEKPAQYWEELEKTFKNSSTGWFATSCVLAIVIIVGLVILLVNIPNMFTDDAHWFDVVKNSAIITVIASVAIYILRTTMKMAMSSLHLSRDAKERSTLTYFYLSLINDRAVTEKERALIINSLFSRSDTGLLKNESAPTMSGNVSELVQVMTKN